MGRLALHGHFRDNVDPEFLEEPKSWNVKSILTFVLAMGPLSSPFDICTFCINWYVSVPVESLNILMTIRFRFKYGIRRLNSPLVGRAQAHWFIEGSITQVCNIPGSPCPQHGFDFRKALGYSRSPDTQDSHLTVPSFQVCDYRHD